MLSRINLNPCNESRSVRLADVPAEPGRQWVVLHVVVADHGEVGHFEPAADVVKEAELGLARVLDVVPDELDEVRPDQAVDFTDHPVRNPHVFEVWFRQVQVTGNSDDDRDVGIGHRVLFSSS